MSPQTETTQSIPTYKALARSFPWGEIPFFLLTKNQQKYTPAPSCGNDLLGYTVDHGAPRVTIRNHPAHTLGTAFTLHLFTYVLSVLASTDCRNPELPLGSANAIYQALGQPEIRPRYDIVRTVKLLGRLTLEYEDLPFTADDQRLNAGELGLFTAYDIVGAPGQKASKDDAVSLTCSLALFEAVREGCLQWPRLAVMNQLQPLAQRLAFLLINIFHRSDTHRYTGTALSQLIPWDTQFGPDIVPRVTTALDALQASDFRRPFTYEITEDDRRGKNEVYLTFQAT